MFAIRPRIVHKGLILLSVPLVFLVIAAITMIFLQHSYSQAVQAEAERAEVLFHIRELWKWNISVTANSLGERLMVSIRDDRNNENLYLHQFAQLQDLVAGDAEQSQRLNDIQESHESILKLCKEVKESLSAGRSEIEMVLALSRNLKTWEQLIAEDMQANDIIRALRGHELDKSTKAIERVRFLATLIQVVLVSIIIGSAVIAYLLFRFFMRGIHRGVQALTTNIKRFKTGEPLAPPLEGSDELALLDTRFHQMADEVAAAQKMKQAFVSTVSTELSVPMASIRDHLVELSNNGLGELSEDATKRAVKAKQSLDRLMTLLKDLLALQSPGSSRMEITPRACSLKDIVQASIDAVHTMAEKNNVRLETENTEVTAYADPDRIVQVLVNLLSNAIKFSDSGAAVVVSAVVVGDQVEVRVKDCGRGVPAHLRESIFEKFQQVATTDATEKGGTGLGLPICKEIVELHGGKIGVGSQEGKGSTFWFRLPARSSAKGEAVSPAPSPGPVQPKRKPFQLAPKTIYAKGLILISVPLIVELAFGSTLFSVQHFFEEKLNTERRAVEVLNRANEAWINCAEFVLLQAQYVFFGGPKEPINERIDRFNAEFKVLEPLVADHPVQKEKLALIRTRLDRILVLCDKLRPTLLKGRLTLRKLQLLKYDMGIFTRARRIVLSLQEPFERIGRKQFVDRNDTIEEVELANREMNSLLLRSIIISTVVAMLLFIYFIRTINRGINVMVENTERFKQGKELAPPSTGGDELAEVDAAFHDMAMEIKEAQATKQAIMSTISHDLRSPLTSVSGYFSLLSAGGFGDPTPEVVSIAEKCERDVDQLIRLISDLLDLDKIEAGKLAIRPRVLPVEKVLERAINQVTPFAEENAVTIKGEESSASIYADPDRIVQALANLLSSAVKLSPGGSCVDASAVQRNGTVEIRVTSSSASTSSELLSTQFDRYHKREHGLKLELPVSKELVKLHGGTIGVAPEQPGCTLWICVPAREPSSQAA